MFLKNIRSIAVLLVALIFCQQASADTIIKIGLGATGPDVQLANSVFGTIDDGQAGTAGMQDTNVEFTGFLSALPAILSGASFSLTDVALSGLAEASGSFVTQQTSGGAFSLFSAENELLLSGVLSNGIIIGSLESDSGSFFNTAPATFTGGSLLSLLTNAQVGISFSLTNILSQGSGIGLGIQGTPCPAESICLLADFTADATGNISGAQVPEPATMTLLLGGLLAGARLRSRKQEV